MTGRDPYAGIAPAFDVSVGPLLGPVYRGICLTALHGESRKVLDMGCGTGALCRLLDRAGGPQMRVAGVDSSPAMLEQARAHGPGRIEYVQGNAAQTGFKQASFDTVTICLALHENKPDVIKGMLDEAKRVATSEGRLIVADHAHGSGLRGVVYSLAALPVERLAGINHYRMYRRFMKEGGVTQCLFRHGFRVEQTHSFYGGTVAVAEASW